VAWIARVAAQRFGSGGVWCPSDKEVGRPKEYIPGRVFSHPDGEEIDGEATIVSLQEAEGEEGSELAFSVELRDAPGKFLPSLAAKGSEDSVVLPKNSKAAISYQVTREEGGFVVRRTPAPVPEVHEGYSFEEVYGQVDISDIAEWCNNEAERIKREEKSRKESKRKDDPDVTDVGNDKKDDPDKKVEVTVVACDDMVMTAIRNVLSNNFAELVDIFRHYATERQVKDGEPDQVELAISLNSLAKFVRTCRLSSETCSFFEIQRVAVRPEKLLITPEEEFPLGLYEADFRLPEFFEALIRISHLKGFGLKALCDKLNKLIHTQVLPYATGDDDDPIREMIQRPAVQEALRRKKQDDRNKDDLRRFYTKRIRLERIHENPPKARSINLLEFIQCLGKSDQLDEAEPLLTRAAVKDIWLLTLSFDVSPDLVSEEDQTLEVALSEFEEILARCVLQKNKVAEDNLPQQTATFLNKFLRFNQ